MGMIALNLDKSMPLTKYERLELIYKQLALEPACSSFEEAYILLSRTINKIEDDFSGIPYNIDKSKYDNRIYPPFEDSRKLRYDHNDIVCYRNKANYTYFSKTGAITVLDLSGKIVFEKPNNDGIRINI
jgi:hypothetical protein